MYIYIECIHIYYIHVLNLYIQAIYKYISVCMCLYLLSFWYILLIKYLFHYIIFIQIGKR